MDLAPFRALQYDPEVAGLPDGTSAPAYDELDPIAYTRHRTASPYTVLELLADDAGAQAREEPGYAAAAATLRRWLRMGVLRLDATAALHLYEQHEVRGGVAHVQRGVLAALALEPLGGHVHPHEDINPDRAARRLARLRAVPVDVTPVTTIHLGAVDLGGVHDLAHSTLAQVAFTDAQGVHHRVWRITDPAAITAVSTAYRDVHVVIADGHHRYATALAFSEEALLDGVDDPRGRTLAWVVDASSGGTEVKAVHRLVRQWAPGGEARLAADLALTPFAAAAAELERAVAAADGLVVGVVTVAGNWLGRVRDDRAVRAEAAAVLGTRVAALTAPVLERVLQSRWTTSAQAWPDLQAAAAEVAAGRAVAVLVPPPVPVDAVVNLALAGERLPPKTTWFRPKPRAGLVLRPAVADLPGLPAMPP